MLQTRAAKSQKNFELIFPILFVALFPQRDKAFPSSQEKSIILPQISPTNRFFKPVFSSFDVRKIRSTGLLNYFSYYFSVTLGVLVMTAATAGTTLCKK